MEALFNTICNHAHEAHWIIFILLMLAGLNIPFSEDLLVLSGGAIASTCIPEHTVRMFVWIFLGCWISAWEAYWLGRGFGPRLYSMRWFKHVVTPHRIARLHHYYEKFGLLTFVVGRFCPGGIRNALFMSSGLGKMPFATFIARDGFASILSTSTLFYIGFQFGQHHEALFYYFQRYELILGFLILSLLALLVAYLVRSSKKA